MDSQKYEDLICKDTKMPVYECPCLECDTARVKALLVLKSHKQQVPQWLQDATGIQLPKPRTMWFRLKEWL